MPFLKTNGGKLPRNENLRAYFKYVSFNVLGMLGVTLYILADTFFVAKGIGLDGLAALNISIPVYCLVYSFGLMIGMGAATRYSISRGKGEKNNGVFANSIYFFVAISIIFVLLGIFLPKQISTLLGANEATLLMTTEYVRVIFLFSPAFMLNNILVCFVRNDNNPTLSMAAMILGSLANIVLDYILIFPCKMGIFGAAIATGIAPLVSMAVLSLHFILKKNGFKFQFARFSPKSLFDISSLGIFTFVAEMSNGVTVLIFNIIILRLAGNIGVAAYCVVANISFVVVGLISGVAQGVQPLISKKYGEGKKKDVKQFLGYALVTVFIVATISYIIVATLSTPIINIFNSEKSPELLAIATKGVKIYFVALWFVSFNIISAAYFSATENAGKAFVVSVLRGFVFLISFAYLFSHLWGMSGVWLAFPIAEVVVCILSMLLLGLQSQKRVPHKARNFL